MVSDVRPKSLKTAEFDLGSDVVVAYAVSTGK